MVERFSGFLDYRLRSFVVQDRNAASCLIGIICFYGIRFFVHMTVCRIAACLFSVVS